MDFGYIGPLPVSAQAFRSRILFILCATVFATDCFVRTPARTRCPAIHSADCNNISRIIYECDQNASPVQGTFADGASLGLILFAPLLLFIDTIMSTSTSAIRFKEHMVKLGINGAVENGRVLPAGLDESAFDEACDAVAKVIGEENISRTYEEGALEGPNGEQWYGDHYEMRGPGRNTPSGAFRPATVDEVQAIFKVANKYNIPLWVFSRGKNLGYGCTSGVVKGSVALDLHRMNKIIEVNEEYGYAIVEPGVSFFDLYEYIRAKKYKLWISCPALGWGSVVGNTLERGFGYTSYGEHSQMQCGLEVVLPTGELMRSGMGALEGSDMWPLFKGGFGPSIDGLFYQSNLGVVTKMGIHLQPAPQHFIDCEVSVPNENDLGALTSTIASLQRQGVLQGHAATANVFRQVCVKGPEALGDFIPYWQSGHSVPYSELDKAQKKHGLGYWKAAFALYGTKVMVEAAWLEVQGSFSHIPGVKFNGKTAERKDYTIPLTPDDIKVEEVPLTGNPTLSPLPLMDIRGRPGGHTCFSPIFPTGGKELSEWFGRAKQMFIDADCDFFSDFHTWGRYTIAIVVIVFGPGMGPSVDKLYAQLMEDAAATGHTEYRTHIDYMDNIAGHFNFNNGSQRAFLQNIKDLTDPKGVLSQGKSGLWNAGYSKAGKF